MLLETLVTSEYYGRSHNDALDNVLRGILHDCIALAPIMLNLDPQSRFDKYMTTVKTRTTSNHEVYFADEGAIGCMSMIKSIELPRSVR